MTYYIIAGWIACAIAAYVCLYFAWTMPNPALKNITESGGLSWGRGQHWAFLALCIWLGPGMLISAMILLLIEWIYRDRT